MPTNPYIGDRIRSRRQAINMTQNELAEKVGVNQSYISSLESGTRKRPSYHVVERIAETLGCSPRDLTDDSHPESLSWFWKAKFAGLDDGDLLRLRRFSIEERAQWIVNQVVEAFGLEEITYRTSLTPEQIRELQDRIPEITPDQVNKLGRLNLPKNFLLVGEPPPSDEDLQALLNSPDCHQWLKFFRRCHDANVLPTTLALLLDATLQARQIE